MKKTILPIAVLVLAICMGVIAYQSVNRDDELEDATNLRTDARLTRATTQPRQTTLPTAETTTAPQETAPPNVQPQQQNQNPNGTRPYVPQPTEPAKETESTTKKSPVTTTKPPATAPIKTHPNMVDALIDAQDGLPAVEAGMGGAATADVTSRKNTIVYTFTMVEAPVEGHAAIKADMEERLDDLQQQMDFTIGEMRNSYGIEDMAIQMIYKTPDGTTITSRTFQ